MAEPRSPQRLPPSPDDDPDLDDDDLFDTERGRLSTAMRVFYVFLVIGVAAMIAYLVLIILYPDQFGPQSFIGADAVHKEHVGDRARPGFLLGGVRMGMAPDQVRAVYSDLRLSPGAEGGLVGFFPHHEGQYQVWFRALEFGSVAYRIRSEHLYPKVSYLKLMSELGERFGDPVFSDCGADGAGAIQCSLNWKLRDTDVEALIRTQAPAGGGDAATMLAVTATDTRPPSRATGKPKG